MRDRRTFRAALLGLTLAGGLAAPAVAAAQQQDRPVGILRCDAPGERQETGAAVGAVLGGLVGSQVAGDDDGILGALAGAAVGGAAGSYIGCEQQRREAPPPPPYRGHAEAQGGYVATANVNVRSGPGTEYGRVGGLRSGQSFQAGERLGDWIGVVENGQVVGYVHGGYARPY